MLQGDMIYSASGSATPTDLSDTDFQNSFATESGKSTWTFADSTYGNYLTLVSPGGNTFHRNNSFFSGGFPKNSYIQYNISGYGWNGFGIYKNTNATNNVHIETTGSVYYNAIYHTSANEHTYFYTYFANGNNATSGNIQLQVWHDGSGGSYYAYSGAKYYGDANPTFFRAGLDEDGFAFIEFYTAGGTSQPPHDGTGFTKQGPFYIVESNKNVVTDRSTSGLINFGSDNFQFSYGNYDGGPVEKFYRVIVRTPQ